ncbi:leucine zipper domain-containing protein [Agrobacterium sp. ST15.13.013]|nr:MULTISPECIES: leucine zipper domain-containing protein [Agrobacterium]MCZ7866023.1 leucine zipper domain-containing protein [Agrobacterium salinitolerans]MDA5639295.1 leucine zipper domain-containing protein [Agrobacterium sp. ST15.13.013]MDA6999230.1 leucine zipper domain-containing protein [Agrobacterium salinitolerans]
MEMSEVCAGCGISRKTGYRIFYRYRNYGLEALTERSRRPIRYANRLPDLVEAMIPQLRKMELRIACCDLETRVEGSIGYSLLPRSLLKYTSDSRKFPLFRLH